MIECKIDKVVNDKSGHVVYIHVTDAETGEILDTTCVAWKNKKDFKAQLKSKTKKIRNKHESKKSKEAEVEQALAEFKEELNVTDIHR